MGKLAKKLEEYDSLPALPDVMAVQEEVGGDCWSPSQLELEPPSSGLASLAERTRSQLLAMRPSAATTSAGCDPCLVCDDDGDNSPQPAGQTIRSQRTSAQSQPTSARSQPTSARSRPTSARSRPTSADTAKPKVPARLASMITHDASCTSRRSGAAQPGHSFGTLPRASPSGTMVHHAPRAAPTAAAALGLRLKPARTPPAGERQGHPSASASDSGTPSKLGTASSKSGTISSEAGARPSSSGRTGHASSRGSRANGRADGAPPAEPAPFGADARGTGPSWSRGPQTEAARQPQPRNLAPFAFVVCCGEPYDGYCCKRHHPDCPELIVCCEAHDPVAARKLAKSAMGGRVGAGKGPAFSIPSAPRQFSMGGPVALKAF